MAAPAAAKWIAVHGNAAISDTSKPVRLFYADSGATATPATKTSDETTGKIHFPIPSPPTGSVKASKLKVEFSSTSANVTYVSIYYGTTEVFTTDSKQTEHSLNTLAIPADDIDVQDVATGKIGDGISVNLQITFGKDNTQAQSIKFKTVGIYC